MIRKLIGQLSGLTLVQGLATLIPLAVVPQLMKNIGPSGFGHFNLALVLSSLFIPVLDMGYDLYASRRVARGEEGANKLLGMQLQQKVILLLPVVVIYLTLVFAIPDFRAIKGMMLYALIYSVVTSSLPNWYFEGNKRFMIVQLSALAWKIIYAIGVIVWVKYPEQESWVMAFNSLGALSVLVFYYLKMASEGVRPEWVDWQSVRHRLKANSSIFMTPMTIFLVSYVPSLIVGFLLGPVQFGYYSVVDRVLQAFRLPATLLSTVVYVQYNNLLQESSKLFRQFFNRVSIIVVVGGILGAFALLMLELPILKLLTSNQVSSEAVMAYRILIWSGVFILQRNHLQKLLLSLDGEKVLAVGSLVMLVIMPLLFPLAHETGGDRALYWSMLGYELSFVALLSVMSFKLLAAKRPKTQEG